MGLALPEGEHTVVFSFETPGLALGVWISVLSFLLAIVTLRMEGGRRRRKPLLPPAGGSAAWAAWSGEEDWRDALPEPAEEDGAPAEGFGPDEETAPQADRPAVPPDPSGGLPPANELSPAAGLDGPASNPPAWPQPPRGSGTDQKEER